ncbi:unnamed protein product, partial [Scytosiphon promiscuus]
MHSALRRCVAGYAGSCRTLRVNGVHVDGFVTRTSIRSLSGTKKGRGGRAAFQLLDEDIDEKFVKGSGPGGQKINKVRNCVQLTHLPTGVSVSCQDSRELHANRHIARKRLTEKVEFQLEGEDSKVGRRIDKIRTRKARSQRKARLKHHDPAGAAVTRGPSTAERDPAAASRAERVTSARGDMDRLISRIMAAEGGSDGDGGGG